MLFYAFLLITSLIVGFKTIGVHSRQCYEGQHQPRQTSCSKYQVCRNRMFVDRECDFGVYNDHKKRCEFSDTICRVRTDNSWHSLVVPDCNIEKNRNMNFQHPFDCSKFYKCDQSRLIEKRCQIGYYWNQQSTACERESTCEAAEPFRYGENRRNNAPVTRRHGRGCDKVDEDDTSAEKPLLRKRVSFFDDSNSSEMADSYGA